jgi:hypothetical protein
MALSRLGIWNKVGDAIVNDYRRAKVQVLVLTSGQYEADRERLSNRGAPVMRLSFAAGGVHNGAQARGDRKRPACYRPCADSS